MKERSSFVRSTLYFVVRELREGVPVNKSPSNPIEPAFRAAASVLEILGITFLAKSYAGFINPLLWGVRTAVL